VLQLTGPAGNPNPVLLSSSGSEITLSEVPGAAANSQPTYTAAFRVTTSGNYAVTAAIGGVAFGVMGGGAATVVISAGPISAATTSASGAGLTDAIAGDFATVYIAPRDAFGNLCMLYDAEGNRVERKLEMAAAPGRGY
jgi:hypothetical protein